MTKVTVVHVMNNKIDDFNQFVLMDYACSWPFEGTGNLRCVKYASNLSTITIAIQNVTTIYNTSNKTQNVTF